MAASIASSAANNFEQMIAEDAFLEHAEVFGNLYGTARHFLADAEAKGKDLLLDIDVQGAAQLRVKVPESVSIFVLPPDRNTLEHRLRHRSEAEHVADEAIILRRLEKAREEIGNYPDYRYILVNGKLDQAVEELSAIVWSERLKRHSPDALAIDAGPGGTVPAARQVVLAGAQQSGASGA